MAIGQVNIPGLPSPQHPDGSQKAGPADAPNAPTGLSATQFKVWLQDELRRSTPAGTSVRQPSAGEYDKLWSAYQRYGTLNRYEASAAVGADPKIPDTTLFSGTAAMVKQGKPAAAAPKPDVASQGAQNPTANSLTQGQFSAQPQATSLFGSGGIDPTTPLPGMLPGDPESTTGGGHPGMGSVPGPIAVTQTADQWLTNLYKMPPTELAKLQQKLYGAGWYDPSNVPTANAVPYGKIDAATIAAFESAMIDTARYNSAGKYMTIDDVINQGAARVPGAGKKTKQPSMSMTNPIDLKNQVQQSAQSLTGQNLSAAEAERFAQYYQAQEKASYAQYAQAGQDRAAGLGGAYTGPPSPTAAAEAYITQHDPNQVQAYGMASRAAEFQQLLGAAQGTL